MNSSGALDQMHYRQRQQTNTQVQGGHGTVRCRQTLSCEDLGDFLWSQLGSEQSLTRQQNFALAEEAELRPLTLRLAPANN